eukprot:TRINITY_DN2340_c0_g1_i1.p1 TRINITY_DN2340_c0_g1~~TRINITY_DN2340_c0_g1_i1.p1  ORF type:complete len:175 (+),score=30.30 TRINITY_DN2340_c0_g1_i1:22-546(+)
MINSGNAWKYNEVNQIWEPLVKNYCDHRKDGLRIAHLNVLMDCQKFPLPNVVYPEIRYAKQFEMLSQMDLDVIGLNEVTLNYYNLIKKEEWVRKSYYVSDLDLHQEQKGNIILTRLQPRKMQLIYLKDLKRPVVGCIIRLNGKDYSFYSTHLTAYAELHEKRTVSYTHLTLPTT